MLRPARGKIKAKIMKVRAGLARKAETLKSAGQGIYFYFV
jgi:hypothetical protein